MNTTRALALAASLLVPVATACTIAEDDETETSDEETEPGSVQQAAVEACYRRSKPRLAGCYSKFCPSGYYAKSCSSSTVQCCRPH